MLLETIRTKIRKVMKVTNDNPKKNVNWFSEEESFTKQDLEDILDEYFFEYSEDHDHSLNFREGTEMPSSDIEKIYSRDGLVKATKKARVELEKEKKSQKASVIEDYSEDIRKEAQRYSDHIVEWCTYAAKCGEWEHEYDMSQFDEKYFHPTLLILRAAIPDVVIIVNSVRRKIKVSWGNNEV